MFLMKIFVHRDVSSLDRETIKREKDLPYATDPAHQKVFLYVLYGYIVFFFVFFSRSKSFVIIFECFSLRVSR